MKNLNIVVKFLFVINNDRRMTVGNIERFPSARILATDDRTPSA